MTIYLARHGRTDYNRVGRFQGQLDVPLNETGREQAKRLADRVADLGLAALWASPLARARETAEAVSVHIGLPIQFDNRLMETDTGVWTDRLYEDMKIEDPDAYHGFVTAAEDFRFEGGESYADQGDRVMAALAEIERGPKPALVVCHGMVMRLAVSRRTGKPWSIDDPIDNTDVLQLP
ncbi:histidine phosphatase family protein [Actinocrispum wychmicini]|uniref:Putative phosphoglycerate mutase n=1 Tax=Actinocrispum wychmicini TaxID=1213861 RepID=A0A4R2JTT6_9PSEU|nr:histidine phosphatase family protein [Actinocrispum wychmicini]TCO62587.1 putative phosphoglycerate mutase [Actinocrispum wychmicini]